MNQTERLKHGKIETKQDVKVLGIAFFFTGLGCSGLAAITIVGLPLLIGTLPFVIIGLAMMIATPFLKVRDVKCPNCGEVNKILSKLGRKQIKAFSCRECDKIITFSADGSPKI